MNLRDKTLHLGYERPNCLDRMLCRTPGREEGRKFDVHARKARMNIKFPTFLATGCAALFIRIVGVSDSGGGMKTLKTPELVIRWHEKGSRVGDLQELGDE